MYGFQWCFVAVDGPVMNGLGKYWLLCLVMMVGPEKHCFPWLCGVAMAAGLGKCWFQWVVAYGPEKAYFLWLILVVFCMTFL